MVRARVGDWVVVRSPRPGVPAREGQVVEVPHPDGSPPYVVRWIDDDRRSVLFPGADAEVRDRPLHAPPEARPGTGGG